METFFVCSLKLNRKKDEPRESIDWVHAMTKQLLMLGIGIFIKVRCIPPLNNGPENELFFSINGLP